MPSISSLPFCEEVTETVVPGHTCTSPPRCKRRMAVSTPAVSEEPVAMRLTAITTAPEFHGVIGTATGCTPEENAGTEGKGETYSSGWGWRRIACRLSALW